MSCSRKAAATEIEAVDGALRVVAHQTGTFLPQPIHRVVERLRQSFQVIGCGRLLSGEKRSRLLLRVLRYLRSFAAHAARRLCYRRCAVGLF